MLQNIRRQFSSHIRYKIIAPYLFLVLALMALLGALAFWIVANNLQAELSQSLQAAASNTSSSLEGIEADILDDMRLVITSPGNPANDELSTAEAFAQNDQAELERIISLAFDYYNRSRILALDKDGTVLVDQATDQVFQQSPSLEGSAILAAHPLVQAVLNGEADAVGDKYASLLQFGDENAYTMLFIIAPVKIQDQNSDAEQVVGALVFAESLTKVLQDVNANNQSSITAIINSRGDVLASFPPEREGLALDEAQLVALQDGDSLTNSVNRGDLNYQVLYNPLRIRRNLDGFFAVALPRDSISQAWEQTWWAVMVVGVVSLLVIILMGSRVTQSITRPLNELATTALQVKSGDLERRSSVQRSDELGTLSSVLNEMTDRLLDLYRTSRQVGSELSISGVFIQTAQAIQRLADNTVISAWVQDLEGWKYYSTHSGPETKTVPVTLSAEWINNLAPVVDVQEHFESVQAIIELEPQAQLMLPLRTTQQAIGLLVISADESIAHKASLDEPLTAIASMSATAMSNALLYSTVQDEALRKQAILQSIADGVVVLDAEGNIMLLNDSAAMMLQTAADQAIGQVFAEMPLQAIQSGNDLFGQENSNAPELFRSGHYVLSISAAPVVTQGGRMAGEVLVLHDVTAEREIDKAKTDFIATISHELRTPLTSITGYADLMLRGFVGELEGEQKEFIGVIRQQASSMTEVLNNVIIIASIDAGTMTPEILDHSVHSLVEQTLSTSTLRKSIQDKNIDLMLDVPDDLPQVRVDRDHVKIVLMQLIDNARRYTEKGSITVQARQMDENIRIDIIDTGRGISAEEQQRLFKRFQRGGEQGGLATRERGTGLGLAIARSLTEALNGHVWLEQTSELGTTFSLTLPLAHEKELQSDQNTYTMVVSSST